MANEFNIPSSQRSDITTAYVGIRLTPSGAVAYTIPAQKTVNSDATITWNANGSSLVALGATAGTYYFQGFNQADGTPFSALSYITIDGGGNDVTNTSSGSVAPSIVPSQDTSLYQLSRESTKTITLTSDMQFTVNGVMYNIQRGVPVAVPVDVWAVIERKQRNR